MTSTRDGTRLRVALGEYDTGWHDPAESLRRASAVVAAGAAAGAGLVVLPEACTTGWTMDTALWAERPGGTSVRGLSDLARRHGVWLVAGLLIHGAGGDFHNSAVVFDPRGERCAEYRKQRLFVLGREHEAYRAGEAPVVFSAGGVRIALFICYELRFPELFRAVARKTDLIVVIANWPGIRRAHWDALIPARAIENLCYVAAVNRVGEGGGVAYDGGSVAYGPWGERLVSAEAIGTGPAVVDVDASEVARVRGAYPFLEFIPENSGRPHRLLPRAAGS